MEAEKSPQICLQLATWRPKRADGVVLVRGQQARRAWEKLMLLQSVSEGRKKTDGLSQEAVRQEEFPFTHRSQPFYSFFALQLTD